MTLRTITLMAALLGTGLLTACEYCLYPRSPEAELLLKDDTVVTTAPVKLHVLGMSCPKCVSNVEARCPPAEEPMMPMRCGFTFHSGARARTIRIARVASCNMAGCR